MRELPRWLRIGAETLNELKTIRVDLHRSLIQHRGLALSVVLPGVALTAIYTFAMWPQTAADPHFIGIVAVAAVLLLVSAACAAAAAVTAHNMDPRVYIGADVERVLGIAPMGELPDFAEVPNEIAEVDMLRLANGIADSCKQGSLRRCIVTGTQSGAGVTTVAVRLRAMLESMGRHALLVDATGAEKEGGKDEIALFALPGMGDEGGSRRDELILTDTLPLPGSADTEFLARFADCVVVVAESGVTTRAQLLRSATCLQQLNVSSVGFVVNRIRHTQPSHAARPMTSPAAAGEFAAAVKRALSDAPRRVPTTPKPPFADITAETAAKAKQEPRLSTISAQNLATNPSAAIDALAIVPKLPEPTAWATAGIQAGISEGTSQGIPDWLTEALAQLEAKDTQAEAATAETAEEPKMQSETVAGPAATDVAADAIASQAEVPEKEQVTFEAHPNGNGSSEIDLEAMLEVMGLKNSHLWNDLLSPSGAAPLPAREERSENKPSRLSGLRNLTFPADLKNLHSEHSNGTNGAEASHVEEHHSENGDESRLDGLRQLVNPESLKDLSHTRELFSAPGTEYGDPFHDSAKPMNGAGREPNGSRQVGGLAQPTNGRGPRMTDPMPPAAEVHTFIPFPDPAAIEEQLRGEAGNGNGSGNGSSNGSKLPKSQQDRGPTEDPVQILPSRRGQYRRRK